MGILKKLTGQTSSHPTLFAVDILASHSVWPDREKAKRTRVTSGPGFETPLAFLDPVTRFWKMFRATCPLGELPLLEKLPNSGITVNGVLYQRPAWAPITDVTDFSSWPTPTTRDYKDGTKPYYRDGKLQTDTLGRAVVIWPTPVASGGLDGGAHSRASMKKLQGTPYEVPPTGTLNPDWTEWLMGFPIGWTDLKD